jgi:Fe-S cluster biosynthesis and repair protein YggX
MAFHCSFSWQDVGAWAAWLHRQQILVPQRHLATPRRPTESIVRTKGQSLRIQ